MRLVRFAIAPDGSLIPTPPRKVVWFNHKQIRNFPITHQFTVQSDGSLQIHDGTGTLIETLPNGGWNHASPDDEVVCSGTTGNLNQPDGTPCPRCSPVPVPIAGPPPQVVIPPRPHHQ